MNKDKNVANLREDYRAKTLERKDVVDDPILQFQHWFDEAVAANQKEPNAMTLATASPEGMPSARIVLLKGYSNEGFIFYTNYESKKGQELINNPNAALVFCWLEMERQIRIEGKVEQLSAEASAAYFHSRPKGSQIGAWVSPQSEVIKDRSVLEDKLVELQAQYADAEKLPCPPHWGGFIVRPSLIEFWQGRSSRLHDRLRYTQENGHWKIDRLAP